MATTPSRTKPIQDVRSGKARVIPHRLPPLRERPEDIDPLARHFLRKFTKPGAFRNLLPDAARLLARYEYHGNICELENAIEHAVRLSDAETIEAADLPLQMQTSAESGAAALTGTSAEHMRLEDIEKHCILSAMEKTRYNHTRAAAHLGITRRTLGYRIQKHGLDDAIEQALSRLRKS